jgi:hypothetical protein
VEAERLEAHAHLGVRERCLAERVGRWGGAQPAALPDGRSLGE